ncbi:KxYKxGKxW signal peptide domain-containing protein [Lentilactobacillus sp. Marseille-Q4993]|uniref:KxYKxGKxW signal peptide domain-containing protein n=1 Tax=Lentilactobacillus sp. Marseille-Q4993 TaxID=3039492 RepID=UPI0024BCC3D9|nr:KxYKxGKxW signal peptide domain-containing protein [Lentilactobacillus sp. Marseille-Q4993]
MTGKQLGNQMDTKIHYKMYKDGKKWVFAGLATLSMGASLLSFDQGVHADNTQTSTTPTVSKVQANSKSVTSTPTITSTGANKAMTPATDPQTTKQNVATKSVNDANSQPTDQVGSNSQIQNKVTTSNQQKQPNASNTKTVDVASNRETQKSQVKSTKSTTKTDSNLTSTTTAKPASDLNKKSATVIDNSKTGKSTKPSPQVLSASKVVTKSSSYDETNKATTDANKQAQDVNALVDKLNNLLKKNPANTSEINVLIGKIKTSNATYLTKKDKVDELVNAYQNGIKSVTLNGTEQEKTLSKYDQLADQFNKQIQKIVGAPDVNDTQAQLNAALAKLNKQLKDIKANAEKGVAIDTNALNASKTAYDNARTAYNKAVDNYNSEHADSKIGEVEAGPSIDQLIKAVNNNQERNAYEKANDIYKDLTKSDGEITQLQSSLTAWNESVKNYNSKLSNPATTEDDLTKSTQTVEDTQTALETVLNKFDYKKIHNYQVALEAYKTALAKVDHTKQAYDEDALTNFKNSLAKLNGFSDTAKTYSANMAKNITDFTQLQKITNTFSALQQKVKDINTKAQAQIDAVIAWNTAINKDSTSLDSNGKPIRMIDSVASTDRQSITDDLNALGNKVVQTSYAYIDAVNGTKTELKSVDAVTDENGKTYQTLEKGAVANQGQRLQALEDAYTKAVSDYNNSHKDSPIKAGKIESDKSGNDASKFPDFLEGNNGFNNQYKSLVTTLANLIVGNNNSAINYLHKKGLTGNSTDGSYTASKSSSRPGTLTVNVYSNGVDEKAWGNNAFNNDTAILSGYIVHKYDPNNPQSLDFTKDEKKNILAGGIGGEAIKKTIAGYQLVGYSIIQNSNSDAVITKKNQTYRFTTNDPLAEFFANPIRSGVSQNSNIQVYFYYLKNTSDNSVPTTPKLAPTYTLTGGQSGNLQTIKSIEVAGLPKLTNEPSEVTLPPYSSGTKIPIATAFLPEIEINPEKTVVPPYTPGHKTNVPPEEPNVPNTPGHKTNVPPEEPNVPNTPGHKTNVPPEEPNVPNTPGNKTNVPPEEPNVPNTPGNKTNVPPEKPGVPNTPGNKTNVPPEKLGVSNTLGDETNTPTTTGYKLTSLRNHARNAYGTPTYTSLTNGSSANSNASGDNETNPEFVKGKLPQTGEKQSASTSVIGVLLLAASLFGLGKIFKRREN